MLLELMFVEKTKEIKENLNFLRKQLQECRIDSSHPEEIEIENISTIDVDTYSFAAELNDQNPANTLAGKFSVPFAIATTLVNGSSGVGSFTWDAIGNQTIQALAKKVDVREDPSMTAKLPDLRPGAVSIKMTDGTVMQAATETNRGDWADPYSEDELIDKYFSLATRLWDKSAAQAVLDEVMNLDQAPSITPLSRLISEAAQQLRRQHP